MTAKNIKAKPVQRNKPPIEAKKSDETVAREVLEEQIPEWGELGKAEKAELVDIVMRHWDMKQPVRVTLTRKPNGVLSVGIAGKSETQGWLKLQNMFAAATMDPVNARANELLTYLGSVGADNADRYNAALSFIESMEPQNQAEALLLVQMYVTHDAAIRALSQLGQAEWVPHFQTFGNLAAKLLRTSQGQMETLARMRRGGEQVVRHIHVDNRGGQAVIAENVHAGGNGNGKIDEQSHATGSAGNGPALLGTDPFGNGVPISSREGAEAVPYARRHESGSAQGERECS